VGFLSFTAVRRRPTYVRVVSGTCSRQARTSLIRWRMPNDLMSLIPKSGEEVAAYLEIGTFFGPVLQENWRRIAEKAKSLRDKILPERQSDPSPSVLIPLMEAASQESRTELQDIWAALLANSMIDGGKKVRREYVDAAKKIEPVDACVLKIIDLPLPPERSHSPAARRHFHGEYRNKIGLSDDEWHVSINALTDLGFAYTAHGGAEPTTTPFARMFLAACEVK
jgi:Abortive infection alpha